MIFTQGIAVEQLIILFVQLNSNARRSGVRAKAKPTSYTCLPPLTVEKKKEMTVLLLNSCLFYVKLCTTIQKDDSYFSSKSPLCKLTYFKLIVRYAAKVLMHCKIMFLFFYQCQCYGW